ncbi:MAG: hypothetical protein M3220_12840, partial [Chloroflexota bacterium]|nr:hypothetical protein [Chloroflexota bacterium]
FLAHQGYWDSHDGLFHLYRLLSLEEAWSQGHFYPRIFPDFAFGYGFTVLNFYGPLTYYIALVVTAILPSVAAMKLTFALSYLFAALAMWGFARDLWRPSDNAPNDMAGFVAAVTYTYVPYHMADVQLRGALAESWAFVWWPLLFWAIWRNRRWATALTLAALILTHNLSVILVAVPLAVWILLALRGWVTGTSVRRKAILQDALRNLIFAASVALLLTAFYWLPVLLESRYIWLSQDVGGLGFVSHLAAWYEWVAPGARYRYFPEQGVAGEHPLSSAQVGLLVLSLFALPRLWRSQWRVPAFFWWGTLIFPIFLLTPTSIPLWKAFVFPFGLVQYPWRWLGITALATAMVVSAPFTQATRDAFLVKQLTLPRGLRVTHYALLILLLGWLVVSSMQHLPWESEEVEVDHHPVPMWEQDAAADQIGATWTAEFLPLTVTEQRWALSRAPIEIPDLGERTPLRVRQMGGDGFSMWVEVETLEQAPFTFPRFAYPSMQATIDGVPSPVTARSEMGLATVDLPPGEHLVTLEGYPLASHMWLRRLLWLPPLLVLLYGLSRLDRKWIIAGAIGVPLLVLTAHVSSSATWKESATEVVINEPIQFGEQAQLVGVRSEERRLQAGDVLQVRLLWFNLERTDRHYVTFLHLTTPVSKDIVAQHDSEPNMGTVPTPRWLAGQLVEDLHILPLPDDLPPGEYELWGGMYGDNGEGIRPVPGDSGERRLVGIVTIQ